MAKSNATSFFKGMKKEYSFELGCDFSKLEDEEITYPTPYPIVNLMLSGSFFGGLVPHRAYMVCGHQASFKSNLALICAKSVLQSNPNSFLLFYDSEFVSTKENFEKVGIPQEQVIEPRKMCDIEMLSELILNDTINIIQQKENREKTFVIVIDGIGTIADSSTIIKSIDGESNNQMGMRAKRLGEVASHLMTVLNNHNVILIVVNHVWDELKQYGKSIPKGGVGILNICNTAILLSKKNLSSDKDEETNTATGTKFVMSSLKSRNILRDFKLELDINNKEGLAPYSGLFDLLIRMSSHLKQVTPQKFSLINTETGEILEYNGKIDFKRVDVEHSTDFWRFVFKNTSFAKEIREKVSLKEKKLIDEKALDSWSLINEMNNK